MSKEKICPLCGNLANMQRYKQGFGDWYECDLCGLYGIDDYFYKNGDPRLYPTMLYYLLHVKDKDKNIYFIPAHRDYNMHEGFTSINEEYLFTIYPDTFNDKVDKSLINLSLLTSTNWDSINFADRNKTFISNLLFLDTTHGNSLLNDISIKKHMDILVDMDFVKDISDENHDMIYTFTPKGYQRIDELQRRYKVKKQAFIAMWFDDKMLNARNQIIKAVTECGYKPIVIDEKEHNNQIVPEIFYEIKNSSFVVSDLTGHRNGVYYEAGYAEGLGKPVILTCKDSDFEQKHFDVAQKSMIKWENEKDLYERLTKRIKATV